MGFFFFYFIYVVFGLGNIGRAFKDTVWKAVKSSVLASKYGSLRLPG